MRRVTAAAVAVAGLTLAGCTSDAGSDSASGPSRSATPPTTPTTPSTPAPATSGAASTPAATAVSVVASKLAVPWGVAFLPDGTALVSERDSHRLVRVSSEGDVTPVGEVPGVKDDAGEGGLLGLALSPDFANDRTVFAYLTSTSDNRVVKFRYLGTASDFTPVFTGIPSGSIHNGGRIAFGPDRYLYVTAGDAGDRDRAPDPVYLGGKVLRMTAAGKPAPGNPDPGSVVWTRGHRNPQGLAFAGGKVYEAEFGQNSQDEINLLQGGKDYGWPSVEGTEGSARGKTAPLKTFRTSDASPSGLAYANGALWLAALGGERLYRIPVTSSGLGDPQPRLAGTYGRLRTVVDAPDGSLWVTTSNRDGRGQPVASDDRILRVPVSS